jgi:hypothetical protein
MTSLNAGSNKHNIDQITFLYRYHLLQKYTFTHTHNLIHICTALF